MNDKEQPEAEWALAQIIKNPVMFREFINEGDKNWDPLEPHERAWTSSTSPSLTMCCGRNVRKTTTVIEMLYYWAINGMFIPGDPGLLMFIPNKAQKDAVFPRIRSACEKHWLISRIVDQNSINVSEGRIDFVNGFRFVMRIAGAEGKESNVIAIHGSRIWVDEAQDFPWRAWLSLQNVMKYDIEGHMLWTSGVPNGERRENVLYHCDMEDPEYISYNISQTQMSWWTPEIEYKRRKQYYAVQEDSEDYKHYVLGQHGVPTYAVFDRARFERVDYEIPRVVITEEMFERTRRNDVDGVERYHLNEVIDPAPPVPVVHGQRSKVGIGWDPGYSPDPSVFFIMYQDINTMMWMNLCRYVLQRVKYPLQRETFLWLDKAYQFDFLGMDMGGVGKVLYQELTSELAEVEYRKHQFDDRIYPVEFGGRMTVAVQDDEEGEVEEKRDLVKRVAVETVSRWVHEKKFAFAKDDDNLMAELERTKFQRSNTGEPVYKTEDDHQFSAMMCAIMAYENKFGVPLMMQKLEVRPKLITARWLEAR
jgi:hypothetical protein